MLLAIAIRWLGKEVNTCEGSRFFYRWRWRWR